MSGDSTAKITIDADATRVQAAGQKLADQFKSTKEQAKGIGDGLERVGHHLVSHIIGARALLQIFEKIGESVHKYQEEAKKASENLGNDVVSRAQAGGQLGLTGAQTEAFTAPGIYSRKENTAFLGAVAAIRIGGRPPSAQTVARAGNLRRSGQFTEHEIVEAIEKGTLGQLEGKVGGRTALAGQEFQDEANTRNIVNQADDTADQIRANPAYRRGEAAINLRNARNPFRGAVAETLKGVHVFGHLFAAEEAEAAAGSKAGSAISGTAASMLDAASNPGGAALGAVMATWSRILNRTAVSSERVAAAADRPSLPPQVE